VKVFGPAEMEKGLPADSPKAKASNSARLMNEITSS
jgi:hypothetical protein